MTKLMVIAGEASGDLHAGQVIQGLVELMPGIELFGTGGKLLEAAGVKLYYRVEDLAVIGISEVLKRYKYYKKIFDEMVALLDSEKPDAVFLVDYAGFNLRFAEEAHQRGIRVIFYVAPQVWAWKKNRIHKMKRCIDDLLVLFPFEVDFFAKEGMDCTCYGHPLLDIVKRTKTREEVFQEHGLDPDKKVIALLPGSRKNEILKHLTILLETAKDLSRRRSDLQFVVPLASTVTKAEAQRFLTSIKSPVVFVEGDTYNLVGYSTFACVASGTATLETAILGTPHLIYYKVTPTTYLIGRYILRIGDVGLPNIVVGRRVVPELVQHQSSTGEMAKRVAYYLDNPSEYQSLKENLKLVTARLGETGAYQKTSEHLARILVG